MHKIVFFCIVIIMPCLVACDKGKTPAQNTPSAHNQGQQTTPATTATQTAATSVHNAAGPVSSTTAPAAQFPQLRWTERKSGTNTKFGYVLFANDLIVISGAESRILTSPDGYAWTSHQYKDLGFSTATYVNGKYFLLGTFGGIGVSDDGRSWSFQSIGPKNHCFYYGNIAYGNGKYLLSGDVRDSNDNATHDVLYSSVDGKKWSLLRMADRKKDNKAVMSHFHSLTFHNGRFVTIGRSYDPKRSTIYSSGDGKKWEAKLTNENNAVTYLYVQNGQFIAPLNDTKLSARATKGILTSNDGEKWIETPIKVSDNTYEWMGALVYGQGVYVTTMQDATSIQEPDGFYKTNWTPLRVLTSADGVNWTVRHTIGGNLGMSQLYYSDGLLVLTGRENWNEFEKNGQPMKIFVSLSRNGTDWQTQYFDVAGRVFNIAYDKGRFVIVGDKLRRVLKGKEWAMEGDRELIMTATLEGK